MALTPEQIQSYRQKYGLGGTSAPSPQMQGESSAPDPEARIQALRQSAQAPVSQETAAPVVSEPSAQLNPTDDDGILKTIIKDPIKTLLVKPAARAAEALGRTGIFGKTIKQGYEEMKETGQNLSTPIGKYHVEPVKGFGEGGGKQILGETAKAGSYLYGGKGAGNAIKNTFGKNFGLATAQGIGAGAASGALYGGGDALTKDGTVTDVVTGTLMGGAIGGVAGGVVPAVAGLGKVALKTKNAIQGASQRASEVAAKPKPVATAIRAGVDDNITEFVTKAAPEDKVTFKNMFDIAEQGSKDLRFARENRPTHVVGKTVLDRASHLIKVKDVGVQQTNRVLNSLDQSPKDVSDVFMGVLKDMKNQGIVVVKRGNGYQLASQGKIPDGDLDAYKMILKLLEPDDSGRVMRSYRGMHIARQRLFNEFNLAKSRQKPFSNDAEDYVEAVRSMLLRKVDEGAGGKYKVSQKKTAEAMGALREFVQLLGYKGNLENLKAKDLRAGEVAMRVLGNASDRPTTVLQGMDDIARKYGYKGKGNMMDQLQMADILENVFGTTQGRSLRGQVGRAGMDVVSETTGAITDTAQGNLLGLGARAVKAIMGKSKDDQIRAFKELLEAEAGAAGSKSVFGRPKGPAPYPKGSGVVATPKTTGKVARPQGNFYHVTTEANAKKIAKGGFEGKIGAASEGLVKGKGVWLFPKNEKLAKDFGDAFVEGKTKVLKTEVAGKIYKLGDDAERIHQVAGDKAFIEKLRKQGYVGIEGDELGAKSVFIFDPSAIKIKRSFGNRK